MKHQRFNADPTGRTPLENVDVQDVDDDHDPRTPTQDACIARPTHPLRTTLDINFSGPTRAPAAHKTQETHTGRRRRQCSRTQVHTHANVKGYTRGQERAKEVGKRGCNQRDVNMVTLILVRCAAAPLLLSNPSGTSAKCNLNSPGIRQTSVYRWDRSALVATRGGLGNFGQRRENSCFFSFRRF